MAIGSGLGGSFGIKTETTVGTAVAVDRFYRITKAAVSPRKNVAEAEVLAAGSLGMPDGYRVVTQTWGDGSVELPVTTTKFGLLLQHITGSTAAPVASGASAYTQTYPFADNYGLAFSAQVGVPTRSGTVVDHAGAGGKITSAEFSCGVGEQLVAAIDLDFMTADNTTALAAPSYTSQVPFHFRQMGLKLGTFGSEAAVSGVRKVSVKAERPMDTEAFYANAAGSKAQQVQNGFLNITGSVDADYLAKADFEDRYISDGVTSLVWDFVDTLAIGTAFATFRITLPSVHFDTDPQSLDGAGIQTNSYGFTWRYDGTNMPTITYVSADAAA